MSISREKKSMPQAGKVAIPTDANGHVLNRSMGIPVAGNRFVGLSNKWVDILDLTDYDARVFIGLMVKNNSGFVNLEISFDEADLGEEEAAIIVGPQESHAYDALTFGPGISDFSHGTRVRKLRAKLGSGSSGVQATGTIDYGPGSVDDGMTVQINGRVYEFSGDGGAEAGRILVPLAVVGENPDTSYTALVNAINANDGNVTASIDTGNNQVTITAHAGGTDGNGIEVADGAVNPTGATFSGTTSGGSGGVSVVINVW
jgi:hypothetical protein